MFPNKPEHQLERDVTTRSYDAVPGDEDDELIDRLLDHNPEFREMAQKAFLGPRRPFSMTTDSAP